MTRRPPTAAVWFAVLGGGLAWAIQFVAGLGVTFAQCEQTSGRTMVAVRTWQTIFSLAGTAIGLVSIVLAAWLYRATAIDDYPEHLRAGDDVPPPTGRIHFLATVGLVVNLLAVAIMVMTAIGAPLLRFCQQS